MAKNKNWLIVLISAFVVAFCGFFWARGGLNSVFLDTDLGRDLSALSNLWIGQHIIWLGPHLSPGLSASPVYYYIFYPALLAGRASAYSLIIFNLVIAASALAFLSYLLIKTWKVPGALAALAFGLSPLFIQTAMHPGNGITYLFWLVIALALLWFEFPLWIPALFMGLSISFHPAAALGLPILIYEFIRRRSSFKNNLISLSLLILPWTPIIIFEIITKGFLTREFLASSHSGNFGLVFNLTNLNNILGFLDLNLITGAVLLFFSLFKTDKRAAIWIIISLLISLIFLFIPSVPPHYFFGLSGMLGIGILIGLLSSQFTVSKILIVLLILNNLIIYKVPPVASRNIGEIQSAVDNYIHNSKIQKSNKIAVVAALGPDALSPQADDYRFFLRVKGYKVLEITDYSKANVLIEFIESPGFDWKHWSTFEINQFGSKKLQSEFETQGIEIITYSK